MGGPAIVLLAVVGSLGLRDSAGLPAWTRVGLGLRYLASSWSGNREFSTADGRPIPQWLVGVEVSECQLPMGTIGVVFDRGRFLAAMRVSPTRDPWLQSADDREVAADDWARVVSSVPLETIDRIQALTVSRHGGGEALVADAERADGPGLEVLKEIAAELSVHVRTSDTVLVIRLSAGASREAPVEDGILGLAASDRRSPDVHSRMARTRNRGVFGVGGRQRPSPGGRRGRGRLARHLGRQP